jgi:AcrR family transcriptional regulator
MAQDSARTGPGGGRSAKRARTRLVLLRTTVDLIDELGVAGVRLGEVARRAGVSRAAIYANFEDRDALLLAAAGPAALGLEEALTAGAPLKVQLGRIAEAFAAHFAPEGAQRTPAAAYQLHAMQDSRSRSRLAACYGETFARIAARLSKEHAGFAERSLAMSAQALTMRLLWQSLMVQVRLSRPDILASFQAIAELVINMSLE